MAFRISNYDFSQKMMLDNFPTLRIFLLSGHILYKRDITLLAFESPGEIERVIFFSEQKMVLTAPPSSLSRF